MKIYTLIIDHRHGTNIYNFVSEAERDQALYGYVKENWYAGDGNIKAHSRDEAIEKYFHEQPWPEDWYCAHETDLPALTNLLATIKGAHESVLDLAKERDPEQLGLWDAVFTPVKTVLSNIEGEAQR